jgi:hypothetical protein
MGSSLTGGLAEHVVLAESGVRARRRGLTMLDSAGIGPNPHCGVLG